MTECTPTDEQMQADWHAYITTPDEDNYYYDALSSEEADARWSRWLAAHDARVRRDAEREAYTTARSVLAGEDPVEWARGAHGSSMSYPHAIGIMDGLIEDLDEEVSP